MIRPILITMLALGTVHDAAPPAGAIDPIADQVKAANVFVLALTENMPMWDKDSISFYEREEIATVKTDILACAMAGSNDELLTDVEQLRQDYKKLVRLDKSLQREYAL